MYNVGCGSDGHDDDDGESRTYPSRTSWGAGYSLEEKHHHLFEWRWFTQAWGYWDGYTIAQIELMALDKPWIDYNAGDKGKTSGRTRRNGNSTNLTLEKAEAMWAQWEKDRGGKSFAGRKGVTIDEIFGSQYQIG